MNKTVLAITLSIIISATLVLGILFLQHTASEQTIRLSPAQTARCILQGKTYYFTYLCYNSFSYENGDNYFAVTTPLFPNITLQEKMTTTGKQLIGAYPANVGIEYEVSKYKGYVIKVKTLEVNSEYVVLQITSKNL